MKIGFGRATLLATALWLGGAHGCAPDPDRVPGDPAPATPTPPTAAAPAAAPGAGHASFDVTGAVRQAHLAFRRDGAAWTGGHATYVARTDGAALLVTPHALGADPTAPARAPFSLRTRAIGRGDDLAPAEIAAPEQDADGSLAVRRGLAVEHLANTEDGVEQSFTFDARPRGEGNLQVRLAASGLTYTGETPAGLHFRDPATALGVRYGRATWIDARGAASSASVSFDGGDVVLTVPAAVVEASAYPAVLDPVVGPEWGTDNPVLGPANGAQGQVGYGNSLNPGSGGRVSIACSASACLLAWGDKRIDGTKNDIFAARVDPATGTILDPIGIPIGTGIVEQGQPAVAWDGTGWMVVWQEERLQQNDAQIYGARVSTGGTVLDPGGFPISTGLDERANPSITWNGASYMVVWERSNVTSSRIEGARVSPGGVVLDPAGLGLSAYGNDIITPSVAWNGAHHLVVWANANKVQGVRADAAGAVLDNTPIVIFDAGVGVNYVRRPEVASDGSAFLVVWSHGTSNPPQRVAGTRVSAAGAVLDPGGITLGSGPALDRARVTFGGGAYAVVWDDAPSTSSSDSTVRAARVTPAGAVLDAAPGVAIGVTPELQAQPAIAFTGAGWLAAWTDARLAATVPGNTSDVFAARLDPALASQDGTGFLVTRTTNEQRRPAIAYNGSIYLAVWEDLRAGGLTDLYATRITATGTVLDPNGIVVSDRPRSQLTPAVATDGSGFLVAWEDGAGINGTLSDLYATVVSAAGVVSHPQGIPVHVGDLENTLPAVAFDGTNYLVVYHDGYIDYTLHGARVTPAGALLDPNGFSIASAAFEDQRNGAVAFDGTNYLVTWSGTTSVQYDIYGAHVSPAGAVLEPSGFPITSTNLVYEGRPVVASAGGSSLVVYQAGGDLLGAIVDASGTVTSAGLSVSKAGDVQQNAAVAWDGVRYWAVWEDARDTNHDPFTSAKTWDVYGARLTAAGTLLDPNGIAISAGVAWSETAPAIARGPTGEMLVAYQRFVPEAPFSATRVRARIVKPTSPNGTPCAAAAECESGWCADGVCCGSACTGPCSACSAAKTAGTDGVCAFVVNGTDPDGECADDGLTCTTASCQAGACAQRLNAGSCLIGGACFASGAADPANACAACAPAISTSAFSPRPDGAGCADDGLACTADRCQAGACIHPLAAGYCVIGGACVPSGAVDPTNACATCQPAASTSAYTPVPDGAGCADDGVACTSDTCQAGTCSHALVPGACLVGGACFAAGAADPASACRVCAPAASTAAFTDRPDGSACASDGVACTADVCQAGACVHPQKAGTCLIGGACFAALAPNPANACEHCDPAASAVAWTSKPDGAACADDGLGCTADACLSGACAHPQKAGTCLIAGACVAAGAKNPTDDCAVCAPADSPTAWTPIVPCGLPDAGTDAGSGGDDAGTDAGTGGSDAGAGGSGTGGSSTGGGGTGGSGGTITSTGTGGAPAACVPLTSAACACPGGASGTQTCKADGAGYDACACDAGASSSSSSSSSGGTKNEEGGCGCEVPGRPPGDGPGGGVLLVIGLGLLARRARGTRRGA